jgi:hypothetical protein
VQVGEKERAHEQTNLWNQLATMVAEKTVEPASQMPYSVGIIEKAMTEAGYSLKPDKSAKSQVIVSNPFFLFSPAKISSSSGLGVYQTDSGAYEAPNTENAHAPTRHFEVGLQ